MLFHIAAVVTLVMCAVVVAQIIRRDETFIYSIVSENNRYAGLRTLLAYLLVVLMAGVALCELGAYPPFIVAKVAAGLLILVMGWSLILQLRELMPLLALEGMSFVFIVLALLMHGAPVVAAVRVLFPVK